MDTALQRRRHRSLHALSRPGGRLPCYQAKPAGLRGAFLRAFLLVDRQRDVIALFEDGKHLVIFDDEKDLKDKVAYYLAHPAQRAEIASQGRERARSPIPMSSASAGFLQC